MPVRIETTLGELTLSFQDIRFALDSGAAIEYEAIEKLCQDYWTEWNAKAKR